MRAAKNTASGATKTIGPRRPSPSRVLLIGTLSTDCIYASLIAMPGLACLGDRGDGGLAFAPWRPPCLLRLSARGRGGVAGARGDRGIPISRARNYDERRAANDRSASRH